MRESAVDEMNTAAQLAAFLKASLRKAIPQRLIDERSIVIRLGPGAGPLYARMRLLSAVGMKQKNHHPVPASVRSFLFVCFGNIMRSPMAEALLKQAAEAAKIEIRSASAGLHAISGKAAHPWAQAAASEMGISLANHRAKLLTPEAVEQADAVFAMDLQNLAELLTLYPQGKDKFFMLSAYAGHPRLREISDPYLGDLETTRQCYRILKTCVQNLLASRTDSEVSPNEVKMRRG
jgi:protein-tyrosine-phosphatase